MAESVWPTALPVPLLEDCSYSSQPNTIRSQMEAGVAKVRRRFTMTPEDVTFSLYLDRAQIQVLDEFIQDELRDVLAFHWRDFRRPNDGRTAVYRFKSRPKYVPVTPTLWKTTLDLELIAKPAQGRFDLTDELGRVLVLDDGTGIQTGSEGFAAQAAVRVAPAMQGGPVLSGAGTVGAALTVDPGVWTGTPEPVITLQWQVLAAGVWRALAGETAATYTPSDAGTYRCAVTADNLAGRTTVETAALDVTVPTEAPANADAPSISGNTAQGATLTCTPGVWTGLPAPTLAYQWQRYFGTGFIDIPGATAAVYATAHDGDHRCVVTASNGVGSPAVAVSNVLNIGTTQVSPTVQTAPKISGNAFAGSSVYCLPGQWSGTAPIAYRYQWQLQDAETLAWSDIAGATAAVYATPAAGAYRCMVSADNAGGTNSEPSNRMTVSAPGAVQAPALDFPPQVIGAPTVGATLTATRGVWFANPEPTYAWLWQKWDGAAWQTAPGTATAQDYVPSGNGDYRVRVTATNGQGSATGTSPTVTVTGGAVGAGTYTQLRIVIDATQGAPTPMVGTLAFRATVGGANLGGAMSASSEAGAQSTAAMVQDADADTFWQPAIAQGAAPWIAQTLGSASAVGQVVLTFPAVEAQFADAAIRSFRVQGFDGAQWTTLKTITDEAPWAPGETRTYTV